MKKLTKEEYQARFRDPRWQMMRLEIMKRDDAKCIACEDAGTTLNVHHSYYVTGRAPWEYPAWSLSTLCERCHKSRHADLADDEEFGLMEWEEALNFMFDAPTDEVALWELSVSIAMASQRSGKKMPELISIMDAWIQNQFREKAVSE